MTEFHTPAERDLDDLLTAQPVFDLDAVKRRTLARVETAPPRRPGKTRAPLRSLLIAALTCALSISVVAAADYTVGGRISQALGIRKAPVEDVAEPAPPVEPPVPAPQPEPPAPPASVEEPPELDEQIAQALQVTPETTRQLRPAVQEVQQTAEDQDVRMTVLQTLGDPACLYVKMRFDFPESSPMSGELEFEKLRMTFEGVDGYSYPHSILERTETSVTYLIKVTSIGAESLNGRTATVTFENYGLPHQYTENEVLHLAGEAGKPYTTIIYPDGTMIWDATAEDIAVLAVETAQLPEPPPGFTASRRADGSIVVTYDGAHGDQMTDAYWVPRFDAVLAGKWEQSWTISYQDTSRYWTGQQSLFRPNLTATSLRISPLSWQIAFTAENTPLESTLFSDLLPHSWPAQLRHQDGSLTDFAMTFSSGEFRPDPASSMTTLIIAGERFDHPMDLSDITAVLIDGKEFPLN